MIFRRLIIAVVALLLAAQSVRNAAVEALATLHPASAAKFWAGHPAVEISLGLAEIGRASRERQPIEKSTFALIEDAAAKAPLASEPFLVRGVKAQTQGDKELAKRAFLAAQWRNPRSVPASYFLANYFLQSGDVVDGLKEMSLLSRLAPVSGDVVKLVAAYAQDSSNWPKMRAVFRSQGDLEEGVLKMLAQDPRNAGAILAIADAEHRKPDSAWLPILLTNMVASGDYGRAHAIWSSVGGGNAGNALVFDPTFSAPEPPPPFNWSLASSTIGLAERQPGNRLHVIFYGNEDGVLASQLLLLPAGAYRLTMQLAREPIQPEALNWSIRCANASDPVASIGVDQAAGNGWSFRIPRNCPAQWLELSGRSGDIAQQSDVAITGFSLTRADNG